MVLHGEPAWVCLMCCNADVLFSVVVLHWVTSKDSSSNGKSTSSRDQTAPSGKGANGGRDAYGLGSRIQPTVTTHISAAKHGDGSDLKQTNSLSDDELERGVTAPPHNHTRRERSDRLDWARGRQHSAKESTEYGEKGYPMNKIRVQVGQVVEIESETNSMGCGSEGSMGSPRGEPMVGVNLGHRAGKSSSQSTEDLVDRERMNRL